MRYLVWWAPMGRAYYLRSTTWTTELERADKFDTREAAKAALDRAAKFQSKASVKHARIIEETPT